MAEPAESLLNSRPERRGRWPQIDRGDVMAGVTTGIANVPDGMASAVLAGVNPVHGIYTLILGTPLASLTISTQLMMFNTTSAMTLVAVDGLGGRTGESRIEALIVIALVAGIFQLALGVLGLGMLTKFVPNAVMTGFLTGIGALIIMGQLWDLTGYDDGLGGTKLEKTARLLAHIGEVDPWTTAIGLGSLAAMVLLSRGRLANFNLLIALILAGAASSALSLDSVALVSSLGDIPGALPHFSLPDIQSIPTLLTAGIAVGAVGLLQAAGVAQAYPNPDGAETDDSRDFMGQGLGNAVGSFFGAMAGGGSLSGTALLVSAGARTRWAAVLQAGVVLVLTIVFSGLLGKIPLAALAALLIYAASLSFKIRTIETVHRTALSSRLCMIATFLATLVIPLQQAVLFGVILASILFIYRASVDVRVTELRVIGDRLQVLEPPKTLRAHDVVVLNIEGSLFYAGARTLGRMLPEVTGVERPVVVLRIRGQHDLGSTFFKVIATYAQRVNESGGRLILAGTEETVRQRLERSGVITAIGQENIFPAGNIIGESVVDADRAGRAWLSEQKALAGPSAA